MLKRVENPPNPFASYSYEWLDVPPEAATQIFLEPAKSIITKNDSPDISFQYSLNPYRGCFHGCVYCYARRTHQYLDFGAGSDFERKLVVKINAPELLRSEFERPSWTGESLIFSGITDCYQPLEAHYELTRKCLEVCLKYKNPVGLITKGALIERDAELLAELNRVAGATVFISIPFLEDDVSKIMEPSAPRSSRRFRTLEALAKAGVPVGVGVAPMIPGLSDTHIPGILERARDAGATRAFMTLLRLPAEVKDVFFQRLERDLPSRAGKVIHALQEMRGGKTYNNDFGARMRGEGERWKAVEWIFAQTCERLGLNSRAGREPQEKRLTFERPTAQLSLFAKGATDG